MGTTLAHFTANDWAILLLVLLLGLFIGLAAGAGGGRWRRAYAAERDARIETERASEARIRAANERIAELERTQPPITARTADAIGAAARGQRDDLTRIRGIGREDETRLNDNGIYGYADIIGLSASDEAALEGRLGVEPGTIAREKWRDQAELLRAERAPS